MLEENNIFTRFLLDPASREFALCFVFRDVLWIPVASDNIKLPYKGCLLPGST